AETSGGGADLVLERAGRRRRGVRVARHGTGDRIEDRGRVADRAREGPVDREAAHPLADVRTERNASARRLQPDEAAGAGRDADRSAAVVPVRGGHHPRGDRGRGTAARSTRRPARVPRVARRAVGIRLRGRQGSELRRVRPAEYYEASRPELRGEVTV